MSHQKDTRFQLIQSQSQTGAMGDISDASHRFWRKVIRFGEPFLLLGPAFSPYPFPASVHGHGLSPVIPVAAILNAPLPAHQTPIQCPLRSTATMSTPS